MSFNFPFFDVKKLPFFNTPFTKHRSRKQFPKAAIVINKILKEYRSYMKSNQMKSFSSPYFPVFWLDNL